MTGKKTVSVRFECVTPALQSHQLAEDAVVAFFRGSRGERYDVRTTEVSCFVGLNPADWPVPARAALVEALCRPVEEAPRSTRFPGALDLCARFAARRHESGFRVRGPGSVADAVQLWRDLRDRFRGRRGLGVLAAALRIDPERLAPAADDGDAGHRPLTTRLATRLALERYGTALEAVFSFAVRSLEGTGKKDGAELHFSTGRMRAWLAADSYGHLVRAEGPRDALHLVVIEPKVHRGASEDVFDTWHGMLQSPAARGHVRGWRLNERKRRRTSWSELFATVQSYETASSVAAVLFLAGRNGNATPAPVEAQRLPRCMVEEAAEIGLIERSRARLAELLRGWSEVDEQTAERIERSVATELDDIDRVLVRRIGARALGLTPPGSEPTLGWLADYHRVLRRLSPERPTRAPAWSAWAFVPPQRSRRGAPPAWTRSVVRAAWGEGREEQLRFARDLIERMPEARLLYERSSRAAERWNEALRAAGNEIWERVVADLRAEITCPQFESCMRSLRLEADTNRRVRLVSDDAQLLNSVEREYGDIVRRAILRKLGNIEIDFG
jgi:hypothetical protein